MRHSTIEWFKANNKLHKYALKSVILESGISTQAYYQHLSSEAEESNNYAIYVGLITQTRQIHPGMGLRQIWELTRPPIGRDAFMEIGIHAGLGQKMRRSPVRTTFSVKSNRYHNLLIDKWFTSVNQLWVCDITYFQDKKGTTYYLFFLMDAYSRKILGYCATDNLRATNATQVLKMAMKNRNISDYQHQLIHHSDRGSQYIANEYTQILDNANINISMCLSALENAYVERVQGTIKNQYLSFRPIDSLKSLQYWLKKDVYTYNNLRPHTALNDMTPVEFENYLSTIPINQRTKMSVFTNISETKSKLNVKQLSLFYTI